MLSTATGAANRDSHHEKPKAERAHWEQAAGGRKLSKPTSSDNFLQESCTSKVTWEATTSRSPLGTFSFKPAQLGYLQDLVSQNRIYNKHGKGKIHGFIQPGHWKVSIHSISVCMKNIKYDDVSTQPFFCVARPGNGQNDGSAVPSSMDFI